MPQEYRNQIVTGDARELAKRIPDESVDLIFTDPPYHQEFLPLYEWVAKESHRILMPGGFVLAMCGGLYLNRIFRMFDDATLSFYWKYEMIMSGSAHGIVWKHKNGSAMPINTQSKPIIAYSEGPGISQNGTLGTFTGTGRDKRYHIWGQDSASSRYYIDCFSNSSSIVFDPFAGGGTVPAVCKMLGRNWIAFEIDPDTAARARERVANTQVPLSTLGSGRTSNDALHRHRRNIIWILGTTPPCNRNK